MSQDRDQIAAYWATSICDISPGKIAFRGFAIQDLIGQVPFPAMIWLMLRGELPSPGQVRLLEAALVAAVDHGPHAPSIAIARIAISTGLPLNGALASAVNSLDDVHGGAGEQALEMYEAVLADMEADGDLAAAAHRIVGAALARPKAFIPGFGHRFHPIDPRVAPLLQLVAEATQDGVTSGRYARVARAVEAALAAHKGRTIPMNIDGVTAAIFGELGFPAPLARGLFCLSRSVGILSHAWEQAQRKERNKGPIPKSFDYAYTGAPPRPVPTSTAWR